jgi:RNA polymerase sigma factor for flagellar operon FliA
MEGSLAILWQSYKQREDIYYRDRLISNYKPFLKKIVAGVYSKLPNSVDIMDIENYAYVGLLDAIKKYDLTRNIKFETYASYRIKGTIIDGIRKQDWLSRTMRARCKKSAEIEEGLQNRESGSNSNNKRNLNSDGSEKFIMLSIDDPNFYEKKQKESSNYVENIYDLYAGKNSEFVEHLENKLSLKDALKKLTPQQKKIVFLYYFKGKTFKEIGNLMNITESRVSQINKSVLISLRKEIKKTL